MQKQLPLFVGKQYYFSKIQGINCIKNTTKINIYLLGTKSICLIFLINTVSNSGKH